MDCEDRRMATERELSLIMNEVQRLEDEIDRDIIRLKYHDGIKAWEEIARSVHSSRSTVIRRHNRLVKGTVVSLSLT